MHRARRIKIYQLNGISTKRELEIRHEPWGL
jgi:hypothetical protein